MNEKEMAKDMKAKEGREGLHEAQGKSMGMMKVSSDPNRQLRFAGRYLKVFLITLNDPLGFRGAPVPN
jgi:hypothetical protein